MVQRSSNASQKDTPSVLRQLQQEIGALQSQLSTTTNQRDQALEEITSLNAKLENVQNSQNVKNDQAPTTNEQNRELERLRLVEQKYMQSLGMAELDSIPDGWPRSIDECESPKVGIASLTRHALLSDMEFWLDYHFNMGVCHIWLRIQGTPTLKYLLKEPKYQGRVSVTWVDDRHVESAQRTADGNKSEIYMNLIDWQTEYVNTALREAWLMELDWCFHIDDDELIYTFEKLRISQIFASVGEKMIDTHFTNYEALLDLNVTGHTHHKFSPAPFLKSGRLAYANGKSAGRLMKDLRMWGPHNMRTEWQSGPEIREYFDDNKAVVLHYESSTFEAWFKKFAAYENDDLANIPFGFYKESISLVSEMRDFYVKKKTKREEEEKAEYATNFVYVEHPDFGVELQGH